MEPQLKFRLENTEFNCNIPENLCLRIRDICNSVIPFDDIEQYQQILLYTLRFNLDCFFSISILNLTGYTNISTNVTFGLPTVILRKPTGSGYIILYVTILTFDILKDEYRQAIKCSLESHIGFG